MYCTSFWPIIEVMYLFLANTILTGGAPSLTEELRNYPNIVGMSFVFYNSMFVVYVGHGLVHLDLCWTILSWVRDSRESTPQVSSITKSRSYDTRTLNRTLFSTIRVFAIYQILLGWKNINIIMKPTNSPTQGQPNPR